jgi:hypothetical protein
MRVPHTKHPTCNSAISANAQPTNRGATLLSTADGN